MVESSVDQMISEMEEQKALDEEEQKNPVQEEIILPTAEPIRIYEPDEIYVTICCNGDYSKARVAHPSMTDIPSAYEDGQDLKNYMVLVLKLPQHHIEVLNDVTQDTMDGVLYDTKQRAQKNQQALGFSLKRILHLFFFQGHGAEYETVSMMMNNDQASKRFFHIEDELNTITKENKHYAMVTFMDCCRVYTEKKHMLKEKVADNSKSKGNIVHSFALGACSKVQTTKSAYTANLIKCFDDSIERNQGILKFQETIESFKKYQPTAEYRQNAQESIEVDLQMYKQEIVPLPHDIDWMECQDLSAENTAFQIPESLENINLKDMKAVSNYDLYKIDFFEDYSATQWNFGLANLDQTGFDFKTRFQPKSLQFNPGQEKIKKIELFSDSKCLKGLKFYDIKNKAIGDLGKCVPYESKSWTDVVFCPDDSIVGVRGKRKSKSKNDLVAVQFLISRTMRSETVLARNKKIQIVAMPSLNWFIGDLKESNHDFEFPSYVSIYNLLHQDDQTELTDLHINQVISNQGEYEGLLWNFTTNNFESTKFDFGKDTSKVLACDQNERRIASVQLFADCENFIGLIMKDDQDKMIGQPLGDVTESTTTTVVLAKNEKLLGVKGKTTDKNSHEIVQFQLIVMRIVEDL